MITLADFIEAARMAGGQAAGCASLGNHERLHRTLETVREGPTALVTGFGEFGM